MDQSQQEIRPVESITFKQDSAIVIAGMRRMGKSVLAVNILKHLTDSFVYDNIVLFSDTAPIELNGSFDFIKPQNVFKNEEMDDKIPQLMEYQFKKNKGKEIEKRTNMIMVFDDLNLNKKSQYLDLLFTRARHYSICIILLVQYTKHVLTNIARTNVDIFLMSRMNGNGLDAVRDSISTQLNRHQFNDFVRNNTNNNEFVMYNLHEPGNHLSVVKAQFFKVSKIVKSSHAVSATSSLKPTKNNNKEKPLKEKDQQQSKKEKIKKNEESEDSSEELE